MGKLIWIVVVLLVLMVGVGMGLQQCSEIVERKIEERTERIQDLTEEAVMTRFRVNTLEDDVISIDVKFFNLSGEPVGETIELSLNGSELIVEYAMVEPSEGKDGDYIAFPYRIYTESMQPEQGLELFEGYVENGTPLVYTEGDTPLEDAEMDLLKDYFSAIQKSPADLDSQENVKRVMFVNEKMGTGFWGGLREDRIYEIVSHTRGGIEIGDDN